MHEHPLVVLWLDVALRLREFPLRRCDAAVAAVNAVAVGVARREGVVAGEGAAARRRVREVAAVRLPVYLSACIGVEIMETK